MSDDNELTPEAAERLWKMIEDLGAAPARTESVSERTVSGSETE